MKQYGYTEDEYELFYKYALRYLLLFSLLYCCMYCTRTNLANVAPVIIKDMGWTKAQFGWLSSVMFWTYGLGQLVNGRLCEEFGPMLFLIVSAIISVLANLVFSFQNSLLWMIVIWGVNGYVQSMSWPAGMSLLTKWWPGDKRGFASGFALALSGLGQVITTLSIVLGLLWLEDLGWRSAFIVPVFFPLVMVAIFFVYAKAEPSCIGLKDYVEDNKEKSEQEDRIREFKKGRSSIYPYIFLLTNKKFLVWVFVACLQGLIRYGLVSWIPLYYVENFGVKVTSGLLQSLALPIGMGLGTFIIPWMTDKYSPNNRLAASVFSGVIAAMCVVGFAFLDPRNFWEMVAIEILLFVGGFAIYSVTGCLWAFAVDAGGRLLAGTSAGILNFFQYVGAALQAVLYGYLIDRIGWHMIFVSVAGFCLIVAFVGFLSRREQ